MQYFCSLLDRTHNPYLHLFLQLVPSTLGHSSSQWLYDFYAVFNICFVIVAEVCTFCGCFKFAHSGGYVCEDVLNIKYLYQN
jgi:hypothetical protein